MRLRRWSNNMDNRTSIILNAFADWCVHCQAEYKERYEDPQVLDEMQSTERVAMQASAKHAALDGWDDFEARQEAKSDFRSEAYRYFLLKGYMGYETVEFQMYLLSEHEEKWNNAIDLVERASSFRQIGTILRSDDWLMSALEIVLDVRPVSLSSLKRKLIDRLIHLKAIEYEADFGAAKVYEEYGMQAALDFFTSKLPKKRGARRIFFSNLDTMRAFQFGRIVDRISQVLLFNGYEATTNSEVAQLTLGNDIAQRSFERIDQVRWAYSICFRAANTSASGFLNSISRGKKEMQEKYSDFPFMNKS